MNYLKTFLPYIFGNKKGKSYVLPSDLDWSKLNFEEKLMFHTLRGDLEAFINNLVLTDLNSQQIYQLLSFKDHLANKFLNELIAKYPFEWTLFNQAVTTSPLSPNELQKVLDHETNTLSLFAIFQNDRSLPGRLFIRRANGCFVHQVSGNLWSIKVLGLSGRGLPFNHSNGSTPSGVYTVDSVMPLANKNYEFGAHRRMIVNFIEKSTDEEKLKGLLPADHLEKSWWLPSVIGRELGRSLLRIHGTGRINKNPMSSYFPMVPSSGCLTTTERSFMGLININDQRLLLDTAMDAQNLQPSFENESKIHGLLYVIEFDGTYQALEFKS